MRYLAGVYLLLKESPLYAKEMDKEPSEKVKPLEAGARVTIKRVFDTPSGEIRGEVEDKIGFIT